MRFKSGLNSVLDAIGFLSILTTVCAGPVFLLHFHPGYGPQASPFLGQEGHFWIGLHEKAAALSILIILTHILLHLRPVLYHFKQAFRSAKFFFSNKTGMVAALILIVIGLALRPEESAGKPTPADLKNFQIAIHIHAIGGICFATAWIAHLSTRWKRIFSLK